MLRNNISFYLILILFFSSINSWSRENPALVIYQRNSFCQMVLYRAGDALNHEGQQQKQHKKINIDAEVSIDSLTSLETLNKTGNFAFNQEAVVFIAAGINQLKSNYLARVRNSHEEDNNFIRLSSILIGIAGYTQSSTKEKIEEFRNYIASVLIEKNIIVDKNSIVITDNENLVRQSALEALGNSNLDATNYGRLLISLQSDYTVHYRLFNKMTNENKLALNTDLLGGYTQLGRESKELFEPCISNPQIVGEDPGLIRRIKDLPISSELQAKTGQGLEYLLQQSYGRDNARGLAIMKNVLPGNAKIEQDPMLQLQYDVLRNKTITKINEIIDSSISYSIQEIDKTLQYDDYAIIMGEFIFNPYIRNRYLNRLNSCIDEVKRRNILVITEDEFRNALASAANKMITGENSLLGNSKGACCKKRESKKDHDVLPLFFYYRFPSTTFSSGSHDCNTSCGGRTGTACGDPDYFRMITIDLLSNIINNIDKI